MLGSVLTSGNILLTTCIMADCLNCVSTVRWYFISKKLQSFSIGAHCAQGGQFEFLGHTGGCLDQVLTDGEHQQQ